MEVCIDQTKKQQPNCFFLIVWSKKKKGGVSPEHDVTPMASDHLPLRLARLFLIFPSQLAKNKKKNATPSWCPPEIWACYVGPSVTSETWERWAVGFFVYVRACVLLTSKPKNPFFYIKKNFWIDTYSVTGIGYRWNSDKRYNGWPIDNKPTTD